MPILGIDLGGTKLATAVFSEQGDTYLEEIIPLGVRKGKEVGALVAMQMLKFLHEWKTAGNEINSIGISVPGICDQQTGNVWAPNIKGWEDYPLRKELHEAAMDVPITLDSDRACYILGETWKGAAQGCKDAIFLAVGTGIGAGILVNGSILRGTQDIAGAIGWMALDRPYKKSYRDCGCFESQSSGEGMAKMAKELLSQAKEYNGIFKYKPAMEITARHIFQAYEQNDWIAKEVIRQCIELWGMAIANLVSLFNPEKIILGGGVFGPAVRFIPDIRAEASRWAQPVSMQRVIIEASRLGQQAGLFGAGFLALQNHHPK